MSGNQQNGQIHRHEGACVTHVRICQNTEKESDIQKKGHKRGDDDDDDDDGHIPDCKYTEGIAAQSSSADKTRFNTNCCILTSRQ